MSVLYSKPHALDEAAAVARGASAYAPGSPRRTSAISNYIGKAGQLAVMAELALRGYNVAIPEIDIGDDIFVLNDRTKAATRIQVKTATAGRHSAPPRFKCSYRVKIAQVKSQSMADHYSAFVGRCGATWAFPVIPTADLACFLFENDPMWGTATTNGIWRGLDLHFFDSGEAKVSSADGAIDLTKYWRDAWAPWPSLLPALS